jgi:hypothetical protein
MNPSNRRWLGFELSVLRRIKFSSVAVPFSGQPDLDWYLKFWGKQVFSNDLCRWSWWAARALVENQGMLLSGDDVAHVLNDAYVPRRRLHNAALGSTMGEMDACWFDNVWLNIQSLEDERRRALAYSHALAVNDYARSFTPATAHLRRPLSEAFVALWRNQRKLVDNGKESRASNLNARDFISQTRTDLMYAQFPRPEGLAALRHTVVGWRETWVRGADEWDAILQPFAEGRGGLGERASSKARYLELVAEFLSAATHIPKWAVAHAESGFVTAAELGEVIKSFRPVEITYAKDFSEVYGGLHTFIIIA